MNSEKICQSFLVKYVKEFDVVTFGKSLGNGISGPLPIGFPIFIHVFGSSWTQISVMDLDTKMKNEEEYSRKQGIFNNLQKI